MTTTMKATATATATPKKNRKRMNEQMKITRTQQQTLLPLMDTAPGADTKKNCSTTPTMEVSGKKPTKAERIRSTISLPAHSICSQVIKMDICSVAHLFFLFGVCEFYS